LPLSAAFAYSLAARACPAGRIPVSIIGFPLLINVEDLLANQGHTAVTAGEPSLGCDVRPAIRRPGKREIGTSRQPGSLNSGN
jgi:hypothetical protein